jgi:2-dehydropantoate 2-reductase
MRVMVVGAGAVGSWLGGALATGGADVTLVEPAARRTAIATDGLVLVTPSRTVRVRPAVVASIADAATTGAFDVALVAVKSYYTADVAAALAAALTPPRVITVQNGIGNEAVLAAALPDRAVLSASLTTGLVIDPGGTVHATAKGGIGLGAPHGGRDVDDVAAALRAGGLRVRAYADPRAMKWSKLLLNLVGSATSAITGWPPARVFAHRRLFDVERAAWLEALAVMGALGLAPVALPGYPVPLYARAITLLPAGVVFRLFARQLAGARGDRLPSVATDLAAGRSHTENAVLTGAVVAAAAVTGTDVPVSRVLADIVDAIAAGRAPRSTYAGRPEALLAAVDRATGGPTG